MERSVGWVGLVVICLFLAGCIGIKTPDVYVSGIVIDADSEEGVGGVEIAAAPGGITVTTADGTWSLLRAKKGSEVVAKKDGWEFHPEAQRVTGEGEILAFQGRRLPYEVRGLVVDESGTGLAGVLIAFANERGEVVAAVPAQADGSFEKAGLKGTYTVAAYKVGWSFAPAEYTVSGFNEDIRFYAAPMGGPDED
ncbi:MAG TPA: carboxypeptidase-like regulatory domain-containing protein [Limnochordia bacterium]|nr:carboxypeptidase-like regulatory domain-containing protein [Limnochordia bacterium]